MGIVSSWFNDSLIYNENPETDGEFLVGFKDVEPDIIEDNDNSVERESDDGIGICR